MVRLGTPKPVLMREPSLAGSCRSGVWSPVRSAAERCANRACRAFSVGAGRHPLAAL